MENTRFMAEKLSIGGETFSIVTSVAAETHSGTSTASLCLPPMLRDNNVLLRSTARILRSSLANSRWPRISYSNLPSSGPANRTGRAACGSWELGPISTASTPSAAPDQQTSQWKSVDLNVVLIQSSGASWTVPRCSSATEILREALCSLRGRSCQQWQGTPGSSSVKGSHQSLDGRLLHTRHCSGGNPNGNLGCVQSNPVGEAASKEPRFSRKRQNDDAAEYIKALGKINDIQALNGVEARMAKDGIRMNTFLYNHLIAAYDKAGAVDLAMQVPRRMVSQGLNLNLHTFSQLMSLCNRRGLYRKSVELFEFAETTGLQHDEVTYTILMYAYSQTGSSLDTERAYTAMLKKGIRPSAWCTGILLDAYVSNRQYTRAELLFEDMKASGVKPSGHVYTTMIHCAWKQSLPERAAAYFEEALSKGLLNFAAWVSMVHKHGDAGNIRESLLWFRRMVDAGITPGVGAFSALLTNFVRWRLFHHAQTLVDFMVQHGPKPNLVAFTALVDPLSRAGPEHSHQVSLLLRSTQHKALSLVTLLLERSVSIAPEANDAGFKEAMGEVFQEAFTGHAGDIEYHRSFVDALLKLLCQHGMQGSAALVWKTALQLNLFNTRVRLEPKEWKYGHTCGVDLHGLSANSAELVVKCTLQELRRIHSEKQLVPRNLILVTGKGKQNTHQHGAVLKKVVAGVLDQCCIPYRLQRTDGALIVWDVDLVAFFRSLPPGYDLGIIDSAVGVASLEACLATPELEGCQETKPQNVAELLDTLLKLPDGEKCAEQSV